MSRHLDFEKILQAFIKHYGEKEGATLYQTWISKLGLDDTKPYEQKQEKFSWTASYLKYLKEDETAKYFKCEALFPLTSMNNNLYSETELLQATRSLIGKPVDWNHTDELAKDVSVFDAQYEDNCSECLLKVTKDSKDLERIESGNVVNVSIEADCLRGTKETPKGNMCNGLVFTGLALLTKDVLPGVPLTRIMPLERMVEGFTVTKMNEQEEAPKTKTIAEMTADEIATEIVTISKAISDLYNQMYPQAKENPIIPAKLTAAEHSAMQAQIDVLRAQLDGYRQALMQKTIDQASEGKETRKEFDALKQRIDTLEAQNILKISEAKQPEKPAEDKKPEVQEQKKPCLCVLTEKGKWARFHQLRSEGLDKTDAFRILCMEIQEAALKKVGHETSPRDKP